MTPKEVEQYLILMQNFKVTNLKLKDLELTMQPFQPIISLPPQEPEADSALDELINELRISKR